MKSFVLAQNELESLIELLPKEGIILLRGKLAAGKTTLVSKILEFKNSNSKASSPTFSILNEYDKNIFHYDIYQCKTSGFLELGLLENLEKQGLHLIEWGDDNFSEMILKLGFNHLCIDIEEKGNKRLYKVKECIN